MDPLISIPQQSPKFNEKAFIRAVDAARQSLRTEKDYENLTSALESSIIQLEGKKLKAKLQRTLNQIREGQIRHFSHLYPAHPSEFVTMEQAYLIHRYLHGHPDLLDREGDYLRPSETHLPYAIQVIGERKLVVHIKRKATDGTRMVLIGKGRSKKIHLAEIFGSGAKLAVGTPYGDNEANYGKALRSIQIESKVLEVLNETRGVMPILGRTVYKVGKGKLKNAPKANILMPLGGYDLAKLLARHKFAVSIIRSWQKDILYGLAAIHAKGIIHTDIKTDNVIVSKDLRSARITDFGLSQADGFLLAGTPLFMAPEALRLFAACWRGGNPNIQLTDKIDVWGAGIVLYSLEYGEPQFIRDGFDRGSEKSVNNYIETLCLFHKGLDTRRPIDCLLKKMLHPSPENRITAQDALKELDSNFEIKR